MTHATSRALALVSSVALVLGLVVAVGPTPAVALTSSNISMEVDTRPRSGEAIVFTGRVRTGSSYDASKGRVVKVQWRKKGSSGSWRALATTTVGSGGYWHYQFRPNAEQQYRAMVQPGRTHAAAYSGSVTTDFYYGDRRLEERLERMSPWIGDRKTAVKSFDAGKYGTARVQNRENAFVVELNRKNRYSTWIVEGDIRRLYLDLGHVDSKLGLPIHDAYCRLDEGGCLQRFTNGVVYDNANTRPTVVYGPANGANEMIAVAMSQVGYGAPSNNVSKYNRWVGTTYAWCSIFQSWVGANSRNAEAVPTFGRFSEFHSWMSRNVRRGSTPRVGAIAIFDTHLYDGRTAATHAGLVTGVRGSYIHTIEGNTTNPSTGTGRGVYNKTRRASQPLYYFYPDYD